MDLSQPLPLITQLHYDLGLHFHQLVQNPCILLPLADRIDLIEHFMGFDSLVGTGLRLDYSFSFWQMPEA